MKRYDNNVVMVFSDPHGPYQHRATLEFLADMKATYNPDRVVCLGDILDMYSVSAYPKDINHKDSWPTELKGGRRFVKKLAKIFPELDVMSSNHDDRPYKKSRVAGVPRELLIPYKEMIGAPNEWKWHDELSITVDSTREQLLFAHTKTGGALRCAMDRGMTTVLGHHHSKFGATAFSPKKGKLLWGVDAGCLISDKGSPYKYNKQDRGRPIRGCCFLVGGRPIMEPMIA